MGLFSKFNIKYILLIVITLCVILYIYLMNESFEGTPPKQVATPCAQGYWCPVSSSGSKEHRCPGGTYGASTNLKNPACSGVCKAGCVCPDASTTECEKPCPAGYFCVEGTGGAASPPLLCPQGYYCPASCSAPVICPEGIFCAAGTSSIS